jgi:hypothetical protein
MLSVSNSGKYCRKEEQERENGTGVVSSPTQQRFLTLRGEKGTLQKQMLTVLTWGKTVPSPVPTPGHWRNSDSGRVRHPNVRVRTEPLCKSWKRTLSISWGRTSSANPPGSNKKLRATEGLTKAGAEEGSEGQEPETELELWTGAVQKEEKGAAATENEAFEVEEGEEEEEKEEEKALVRKRGPRSL